MTTATNRYLDAIKARLGIPSDNKLAAYFGMTHQRIANGDAALRRSATTDASKSPGYSKFPPSKSYLKYRPNAPGRPVNRPFRTYLRMFYGA